VLTAGLLILRLVLGLVMVAHGARKLLELFQGPGPAGFGAALERLRVLPGRQWSMLSGAIEVVCGLLVAVGLLTPFAALLLAGDVLVAILTVHLLRGFWSEDGGVEHPLVLLAALVALSLTGPGALAVDAAIHLAPPQPVTWLATVIVVLIGVIAAITVPRLRPVAPPARQPEERLQGPFPPR
jgi:putative oxidoreductase